MTQQITRTQWFHPSVKPVRPGLYERRYMPEQDSSNLSALSPDYWDGSKWIVHFSGTKAAPSKLFLSWRGITRGRGRPRKS